MKYIDADKIRNAIESEADNWQDTYTDCMRDNLITILDSLQQEQPDCHTVEDWIQHIKNADQLTKDIFSKGPYDVLYDALNHPYRHCYDAIKEFGELCFQVGVNSVKQEQPEWSEEDEACIRNLESIIYYDKKLPNDTRVILGEFLSNLRPQPKKELSIEKAIQWLDDTFCFLDNSSGRGRDCEITTHDFDSLEEMYDSFRKAVIVDSEPHWKPSEEQLPGIEDPGIPGKDFIPVDWVDACEKYGKWKIVKVK